ncbi:MAG: amidophosphoribosyltransferase [Saprospiraceae bacterium]|nr:amidophosphoribosyltransferase [Saprospiraceae bacterium]MCB0542665.1 amidophosphoribosyltransferase [Saprospiraceae bacterium]MCB0575436.1 amidophosphoribosyltransferase [Saprospiraceae bacterium]MCB9352997.1 amidophosphoribosyltransferase [Lewinellaceae bacterium]
MSDQIKHECGIALVRLRKPLDYYHQKYGTAFYGLQKLQLLMLKMRNRGQDGAGLAAIKLNPTPGGRYISRKRSNATNYLDDLFQMVWARLNNITPEQRNDPEWLKANMPYMGEVLMGHLRYGTHGDNSIERVHPFHRQSNWINRNLLLAGNFNLTNVDELFTELVDLGQYPKEKSDTVTVLEKIGHFLDDEVQRLHTWFKPDGYTNQDINHLIFDNLDIQRLLKRATKKFDGGYVLGGLIGHGDAFLLRDANGIRPAFWYMDDEVIVGTSERPAIQSVFNVRYGEVRELKPGHALVIKYNGKAEEVAISEPSERRACSFERIYFSRGNDREIYQERKKLGEQLARPVLEAVDFDIRNTVFSYIPNTAEAAFYGLVEGLDKELNQWKQEQIQKAGKKLTPEKLAEILNVRPRVEKLVHKDEKQRTFIADTKARNNMVGYVYDVTYGLVQDYKDTLVLLDDSIVRGTTLRDSIVSITARLKPKRIIILSSAPQIRFPDCYGIDMSKMKDFAAFTALLELLRENGQEKLLQDAYKRCKASEKLPVEMVKNEIVALYDRFEYCQISKKISEIVRPKDIKPELQLIFQTLDGLHSACPDNSGDWYFSGRYPTAGGNRVANRAFMNFMENRDERAY